MKPSDFKRKDKVKIVSGPKHVGEVGWVISSSDEAGTVQVSIVTGGYSAKPEWLEKA